ncbi:MAG TPA: serine/threonine-protein kinase [Polyangia bacterium]
MIGETVGNYRILELIGTGGMGVVYLAEHPGIGRKVAVKVLNPRTAENIEMVTRFFNEARAANAVRHPGIVQVFDFGTLPSGATYIVMELLEGESLAARLRRAERLEVAAAVEIACQTADILAAAHARGVIHRDLKPDNLFLVPDARAPGPDTVKVLDFGIAKLNLTSSAPSSLRTRTGAVLGTPRYMSPEQCRGTREVDLRTDIYALGIILYQMLCGWPPFTSAGHGELLHLHIAVPPVPPRSYNKNISEALEAVILKTLAKQPDARQQTMRELERALRGLRTDALAIPDGGSRAAAPRVASGTAPAAVQTTFSAAMGTIEPSTQKMRSSAWRWVAVLGGLALAGVAASVIFGRGAAPSRSRPATKFTTAAEAAPPLPAAPLPAALLPAAPLPAAPAPPSAPAAPAAPAPPPVPAPPAPAKAAVAISSEPPGARVVRASDGADIGVTPFRESWPVGAGVENLRIELPGYRPEPFVVPLDRGVDLHFVLDKLPAPPSEKRRARRHATPATATPPVPVDEPDLEPALL